MSGLREEVGKVRNCECVEWQEGVAGLFQYAGVPGRKRFKYCPWCGKELKPKEEKPKTSCRSCGEQVAICDPRSATVWCGKCGRRVPAVMKERRG